MRQCNATLLGFGGVHNIKTVLKDKNNAPVKALLNIYSQHDADDQFTCYEGFVTKI